MEPIITQGQRAAGRLTLMGLRAEDERAETLYRRRDQYHVIEAAIDSDRDGQREPGRVFVSHNIHDGLAHQGRHPEFERDLAGLKPG